MTKSRKQRRKERRDEEIGTYIGLAAALVLIFGLAFASLRWGIGIVAAAVLILAGCAIVGMAIFLGGSKR